MCIYTIFVAIQTARQISFLDLQTQLTTEIISQIKLN